MRVSPTEAMHWQGRIGWDLGRIRDFSYGTKSLEVNLVKSSSSGVMAREGVFIVDSTHWHVSPVLARQRIGH